MNLVLSSVPTIPLENIPIIIFKTEHFIKLSQYRIFMGS